VLTALAVAACTSDLSLSEDVQILCTEAEGCPAGFRCEPSLGRCLPAQAEPTFRLDPRADLGGCLVPEAEGQHSLCPEALLARLEAAPAEDPGQRLSGCLLLEWQAGDGEGIPPNPEALVLQATAAEGDRWVLAPVVQPEVEVHPGQPVRARLLLLAAGTEATAELCAEWLGDGPCRGDARCLLALAAVQAQVGQKGGLALEYGGEVAACSIECNDPCEPASGGCRRVCYDADHPPGERCDGLDNDCDGETDEGLTPPAASEVCGPGVCAEASLACPEGAWACLDHPDDHEPDGETLCDGRDNDCDGQPDDGLTSAGGQPLGEACEAGQGACRQTGTFVCSEDGLGVVCSARPGDAAEEVCGDEVDNDCDGELDEGEGRGEPCFVGRGGCEREGILVCSEATGGYTDCSAVPGEAHAEVCGNEIDDDCDGGVDEGFGVGEPCEEGHGVCRQEGEVECAPDGGTRCSVQAAALEGPEECDGLDNDCDGRTDEDEGGEGPLTLPCYSGHLGTEGVGACVAGTYPCLEGRWDEDECLGEVVPAEEEGENEVDEDCDGQTDEGFASLDFPGGEGVLVLEHDDLTLRDTSFTLEAWIRPEALPAEAAVIVSRWSEAAHDGYTFGVVGDSPQAGPLSRHRRELFLLAGDWDGGADGEYAFGSHRTVDDGEWQHVAVAFTLEGGPPMGGHAVELFPDGQLVGVDEAFERWLPDVSVWLHIGADAGEGGYSFDGEIGDVRVSTGVQYSSGPMCDRLGQHCFLPEPCLEATEDTVALWHLDEGSGAIVNDSAAGGAHLGIVSDEGEAPETLWRPGPGCVEREEQPWDP